MEVPRSEIVYPTLTQVVEVNRRMIAMSGGYFYPPDNLQNRDPLAYILDAVQYPVFGVHLFPTLMEKAAALGYEIIASHVFFDGNKRTGIHMASSCGCVQPFSDVHLFGSTRMMLIDEGDSKPIIKGRRGVLDGE